MNNQEQVIDCPNCWGYQEYQEEQKAKNFDEEISTPLKKKVLFSIKGEEIIDHE
ncbi:hypothetical protein [Flammeovirga kamogawensis]|uniref:Uncharacterized protein n=1 Tax=Flammeovirga kamogawensis TaxID=373891 RepID=A0ABX8H032_9BACT|nr:hypothetical protein [Flammeovirga kamogawensis]MBB6458965.1 hypothetical protein [Flammeovirga kamogawensis]QWG08540.1 hypothetical protein KM029_06275 [Flammeovirga kamogawensis]